MSLLRHRSTALSKPKDPRVHLGHLKRTAHALLSLKTDEASASNSTSVHELFVGKWFNVYWDIRWLFLRETEYVICCPSKVSQKTNCRGRASLKTASPDELPTVTSNSLALLERMKDLIETQAVSPAPSKKSASTYKVWITEFTASSAETPSLTEAEPEDEKEDDWRTFFDTPVADANESAPTAKGQRVYKLSISKSVLSPAAHNAQMSATWLALVPSLMTSKELSSRALTVLHGVVAGPQSGQDGAKRFKQPIKLMDWIAGCVDHG